MLKSKLGSEGATMTSIRIENVILTKASGTDEEFTETCVEFLMHALELKKLETVFAEIRGEGTD